MNSRRLSAEEERLAAAEQEATPWKRWGPYLSERQWGTVREDCAPRASGPAVSKP
jgi:hypothetical protein